MSASGQTLYGRLNQQVSSQLLRSETALPLDIPDMRGANQAVTVEWNTNQYTFEPGVATTDVLPAGGVASSALVVILAAVMYLSRQINWYALSEKNNEDED